MEIGYERKTVNDRPNELPGLKKIVPSFFEAVAEYLITARRAVPAVLSW